MQAKIETTYSIEPMDEDVVLDLNIRISHKDLVINGISRYYDKLFDLFKVATKEASIEYNILTNK